MGVPVTFVHEVTKSQDHLEKVYKTAIKASSVSINNNSSSPTNQPNHPTTTMKFFAVAAALVASVATVMADPIE